MQECQEIKEKEITKPPKKEQNPEGKIIEVIGNIDEAGVDMLSLIKEYKLPSEFPKPVIDEAKRCGKKIDEIKGKEEEKVISTLQSSEREAEDMKKAEYMEDKIGEEYEGRGSSVTSFGMFVELANTVEGLVRFADMGDDYFIYDEDKKRLIGERTNITYKIGDKVKVQVIKASKLLRQVDFSLTTSLN